jgi:outer membrane protein assembly factor BamB
MAAWSVPLVRADDVLALPMFRGNPARTGTMHGPGPVPSGAIAEIWRFPTADRIISSPAVSDGIVFVGSLDGSVYAVNAADGSERWHFATGFPVVSSPAVVDGMVYIGNAAGFMYALAADNGSLIWEVSLVSPSSFAPLVTLGIVSSPVVVNGTVYVGANIGSMYEGNEGSLFALDAGTGAERWRMTPGDDILSSPAVVDDVVYVGSASGILYTLDAELGTIRWSKFIAGGELISAPAIAGTKIYIGTPFELTSHDLATGQQYWRFSTSFGFLASPAVVDDVVYAGSLNGRLYAITTWDGTERWNFVTGDVDTMNDYARFRSSPTVVDGVVYVGSGSGSLYAVNADDGAGLWEFAIGAPISSSPSVVDGVVYIGSHDGNLYAIGNAAA